MKKGTKYDRISIFLLLEMNVKKSGERKKPHFIGNYVYDSAIANNMLIIDVKN